MLSIGIVSCDKWINKLEEDKNLQNALKDIGINANIISWQQPLDKKYDLLILRSIWGYQDHYEEFKKWLLNVKNNNIQILNNVDMVLDNIKKDIQFKILKSNNIDCIDTKFITKENLSDATIEEHAVVKPSISGSGENTFIISEDESVKNSIKKTDVTRIYRPILNDECLLMVQPFIKEINDGEYSCIFIDGKLTHVMLRFPNIFHDKKRPYLVSDIPKCVYNLARKVEQLEEFKGYLYMRVDMVVVNNESKIMEVELTDPDLLTKYIEDNQVKKNAINTFANSIKRRVL